MRYIQSTGSQYGYPSHDIDPQKKNAEWCMMYAKAAYNDWSFSYPKGVFANNNGDYEKFRMYGLGKQPVTPYKKWLGVDEATNNTWMSIDWSVRAIVSPFRDKAISRLMEQSYGVVATPIDMLAKADLDNFYAQMKAKLAVRQLIQQQNPEMANHPMIALQTGDPMDIEELEMRVELGEQFNRSKDAELAIALGLYENNYTHVRRTFYEDLFDFGVAGYKEWLGDDNKAKFRKCNLEAVVTSFCKQADFSDMIHAGEVIDVSLVELATLTDKEGNRLFTEQQLQEFAGTLCGKFGNPSMLGKGTSFFKPYDKFKCKVLDIEFYSYDEHVWRNGVDENGNADYRKAEWGRGRKSNKYDRKRFQMVYKVKWLVGTDYCYDWGIRENEKRSPDVRKKAKTSLSFKFYAYNFYEMRAQGFMERLIPYLDDYQLTILKIQNFKNRAVPSGWWIDLDALENVALNKGGKNMEPKELLQMFFETGVLVGRSIMPDGTPMPNNWKPVIPIENTAASELAMFYQDLIVTIQAIERITGYNDVTSGNPNPKLLNAGYEMSEMSTNHALFPMKFAEKWLTERLSEDVLVRMSQGVKRGDVEGYAPYQGALNSNMLTFIKLSPTLAIREYGVMLQEKTTEQERIWIMQQIQQDIANGFLDTTDAIFIINTHNAKQAMMILAYKIKKAKQAQEASKMQAIQIQTEGNMQVAQATEQAKMQTLQMQYMFELEKEKLRVMGEVEKKRMEVESQERIAMMNNTTKLQVSENEGESKVAASLIQGDAKETATVLQGEYNKAKQEIANKKPVPKSSSK
jgi:hypothetical protein